MLQRQRQVRLREFGASVVYIASFRPVRDTQRDPLSRKKKDRERERHQMPSEHPEVIEVLNVVGKHEQWINT